MKHVRTLISVFSAVRYSVLAFFIAFVVFTIAVWIPNTELITGVIFSSSVSLTQKFGLLTSLYGSIVTNFTPLSATYTTSIAVLFGIDLALLAFYIKKMRQVSGGVGVSGAAGLGGVVSGSLGIGCASCGTFILTSLLGVFGATGVLAVLPLGGAEFGILGVVLLLFAIYQLLKKIQAPNVCI